MNNKEQISAIVDKQRASIYLKLVVNGKDETQVSDKRPLKPHQLLQVISEKNAKIADLQAKLAASEATVAIIASVLEQQND